MWKEVARAHAAWGGRCWDRRRWAESAWAPRWDSGSRMAVGFQEWEEERVGAAQAENLV